MLRLCRRIVDRPESACARVAVADEHREGVVEPERRHQRAPGARVILAHLLEHAGAVVLDGTVEHGRQGGAGIFDVRVDVAGAQRAIANQRAAKIQLAIDREPFALDRLRDELAEHELLGEIFGADDDRAALAPCGARARNQQDRDDDRRRDRDGRTAPPPS